jgi:alkylation response protein AidB-like acyl-CoA dehydrogenase
VTFSGVQVPLSDVLGAVDNGWPLIEITLQKATAIQCVETVGVMQQELAMTAEYTSNRVQFGRPIGSFQAVQHRLADMLTDVEGARWLAYRALSLLSNGLSAPREVAIAKAWASDACQRVAYSAQHLHGGIGMDLDYDLHFYFEWAKARQLSLGPTPYHLASIEPTIRSS